MLNGKRLEGVLKMARMGEGAERKTAEELLVRHGHALPERVLRAPRSAGRAARPMGRVAPGMGMVRYDANVALNALKKKSPVAMAKSGKNISRIVAGAGIGAVALGVFRNRSGRPADRMGSNRPTGMYGY